MRILYTVSKKTSLLPIHFSFHLESKKSNQKHNYIQFIHGY